MFRLVLVMGVLVHSGLAKPTGNCMIFCDEPWMGGYNQAPSQGSYYGYNPRGSYGQPSARIQSPRDIGYVQPGNYYPPGPSYGRLQGPPMPQLEALFHQTASQSSQSSSSSTGYIRQYPGINPGPAVQQEPLRRSPAKLCANEYNDPCY